MEGMGRVGDGGWTFANLDGKIHPRGIRWAWCWHGRQITDDVFIFGIDHEIQRAGFILHAAANDINNAA